MVREFYKNIVNGVYDEEIFAARCPNETPVSDEIAKVSDLVTMPYIPPTSGMNTQPASQTC